MVKGAMRSPGRLLIGLDDTDADDSIGTGALCRELRHFLARRLVAMGSLGITRHQLLVHPDIPYTSHNSAACLCLETSSSQEAVIEACREFVLLLFHPGADPGLCVLRAEGEADRPELLDFGRRAQREVVEKATALELASRHRLCLLELGGSGLGVIGALSACALRRSGDDGRFIALAGIRLVPEVLTAQELLSSTAIDAVLDQEGEPLEGRALIKTGRWVRPELECGRIIQRVRLQGDRYIIAGERKGRGENDL